MKEEEEKILRENGWLEEKIEALRNYDHALLVNAPRRKQEHEQITDMSFFIMYPVYDNAPIQTFMNLLDAIENETLVYLLKKCDPELQRIIWLMYKDYKIEDISKGMNIAPEEIITKIENLKAILMSLEQDETDEDCLL